MMRPKSELVASAAERSTATANYRDAVARAAATSEPHELAELLDLALATKDAPLARAAAVMGFRRSDPRIVNRWTEANPSLAADAERLWELMYQRWPDPIGDALRFETHYGEVTALVDASRSTDLVRVMTADFS